jgi:opacity protein-like surface antigen
MKKLMIFVGALTLTGSLFAQKPASDDAKYSLEGLANLNTSNGMSWTAPSLRFRYFVNDNLAARLQFGFGGDGSTDLGLPSSQQIFVNEEADNTGSVGSVEINRSQWLASVGAEYHLEGTSKLSPFISAHVAMGAGSENQIWTDAISLDPATSPFVYLEGTRGEITGSYKSFGFGVGAGFDYYVAENLYLGLEMNLSRMTRNNGETTVDLVSPAGASVTVTPESSATYTNIGAAHGSVRIGWRF